LTSANFPFGFCALVIGGWWPFDSLLSLGKERLIVFVIERDYGGNWLHQVIQHRSRRLLTISLTSRHSSLLIFHQILSDAHWLQGTHAPGHECAGATKCFLTTLKPPMPAALQYRVGQQIVQLRLPLLAGFGLQVSFFVIGLIGLQNILFDEVGVAHIHIGVVVLVGIFRICC